MARGDRDLARRVAVAVVAIPLVAVAAYFGGLFFALLAAGFAAVGAWEFYRMVARKGVATLLPAGTLWAASFPLLAALGGSPDTVFVVTVPLALVLFAPAALRLKPESGPATVLAATVFGAAYPGVLLSFAVLLREMGADAREGMAILFLPLVVTWVGDTAAFFVGRAVGGRAFSPRISPHKTWEGAVAGFLAAIVCAILYVPVAHAAAVPLTLRGAVVLGVLIAVFGQMGDLFESVLKRDCGVKDSSDLFPGHGGVLDRVDSLLFAFPVTYLFAKLAWG